MNVGTAVSSGSDRKWTESSKITLSSSPSHPFSYNFFMCDIVALVDVNDPEGIIEEYTSSNLTEIAHTASKLISYPNPDLSPLNHRAVTWLARTITNDPDHPLKSHFVLLPSGHRHITLRCKQAHVSDSFVPSIVCDLETILLWLWSCMYC